MTLCTTLLCLLLATYFCTEAVASPTNELNEKIKKALEPYTKDTAVKIPGLHIFQDPMRLHDMAFSSQHEYYESLTVTDTTAYGMSNFTVNITHFGVPARHMMQARMHIYATLSRLEVLGNYNLTTASARELKSGRFNFTAVDTLTVGTVTITQRDGKYRGTFSPKVYFHFDDMHINLENFTLKSGFLVYEVFPTIEPQLRKQVKLLLISVAKWVIPKIRDLDKNQNASPANDLSEGRNTLDTTTQTDAETTSESPSYTAAVLSAGAEEFASPVAISSYSPTLQNALSKTTEVTVDEATFNRTDGLCKKIKKALEPYNDNGVVRFPGPPFFQDPMRLQDIALSSEAANFTNVSVYGMSNFTVNVNSVGFAKDGRMPVHIHMYLSTSRLEVLGNFTLAAGPSNEIKKGPFNFTVVDLVTFGALKISRDESAGYQKTVDPFLSVGRDDVLLDLDDVSLETDYFLKYELFQAVESPFREQIRLFFHNFADKLIDQIKAIDKSTGVSSE